MCDRERLQPHHVCGDQRAALIIACVYTCMMERGYNYTTCVKIGGQLLLLYVYIRVWWIEVTTTSHVWRLKDSSCYCVCIYMYDGERLQPHHMCRDRKTALWSQFLPSIFIWAPGIELRSKARPFTSPQPVLPWGSKDVAHAFSCIFTCHVICSPFPDGTLSIPWNWL